MTLFWIFFLIAGAIGMAAGASSFFTAMRSSGWPRADGRIISSEVLMKGPSNRDTTYYHAEVTYSYSVGGQHYMGSQISASDYDNSDVQRARSITEKYRPETVVTVFYNPRDPANAVLEPGLGFSPILIFVVGAVFFIAAILGLLGIIGGKGTPASS